MRLVAFAAILSALSTAYGRSALLDDSVPAAPGRSLDGSTAVP
jgi:hypothetical protein